MTHLDLPRLRAVALPPIGRRLSHTEAGLIARAILTFACFALALAIAVRAAPVQTAEAAATFQPR